MIKTRILIPLALTASAAAIVPATAQARSSYCSSTGDVCYGVVPGSSPVKLRISLQGKFFKRYKLCVRGPNGQLDCHRFRIKKQPNGLYGSTVKVGGKKYPFQGKGTYRARWSAGGHSLGPAVTY